MNRELAAKIADTVLYEGYMLYPYRPSSIKNRQRWTFGILYPPGFEEVRAGTERAAMHSECVVVADKNTRLHVQLRFLQALEKQVMATTDGGMMPVSFLTVDDHAVESWDEGVARSVDFHVFPLMGPPQRVEFSFAGAYETEPLRNHAGCVLGAINKTQCNVSGTIALESEVVHEHVLKITIDVTNETLLPRDAVGRNAALLRSLLSAHTILTLNDGEFVSLLDPPDGLREVAASCRNVGNFPVLVGEPGTRDMMLCPPVALYDYPQIAPESAGDFYDATEMDEMLTLRVMTLTEEEKDEARRSDVRARNLLQRTEETARAQLSRTHGAIRGMRALGEPHD